MIRINPGFDKRYEANDVEKVKEKIPDSFAD